MNRDKQSVAIFLKVDEGGQALYAFVDTAREEGRERTAAFKAESRAVFGTGPALRRG
jgi:hypothetical protein